MSVLTAGRRGPSPAPRQTLPGVYLVTIGRRAAAANVYLIGSDAAWTLVDAACAGSAAAIRQAAEAVFGTGARPAAILLTHIHPDHSGSAGPLARSWEVPVYVHPAELPMAPGKYLPQYAMPLDRWVIVPVMRLLPARTRARIEAAGSIPSGGWSNHGRMAWLPSMSRTRSLLAGPARPRLFGRLRPMRVEGAGADVAMMTSALLRHGPEHGQTVRGGAVVGAGRTRRPVGRPAARCHEPGAMPNPAGLKRANHLRTLPS